MATMTLQGNSMDTNVELPRTNGPVANFRLTDSNPAPVTLAGYAGRKRLLDIVPNPTTQQPVPVQGATLTRRQPRWADRTGRKRWDC